MVKKVIKRKAEAVCKSLDTTVEADASQNIKKQKKEAPISKKESSATQLETYQAGGLSNLFGKSADGSTVVEDVVKGATVIEKPKRRKFDPKKKQEEEKPIEETNDTETGEKTADNAKEDGKEKKLDRTKQRENRVLSKSNARATAEDNAKTVFVGNMPLTMNEKSVRRIFSDFGTVSSVRMRNLIPINEKLSKRVTHLSGKLNDKQSSLTFYVKFENEESVENALKYNGTKLEDHVVRVDKVGNKKKDFGKDLAIFVGNLPFEITEDALITFFSEQIGPVEGVRIVRDKDTGKGKGFAFVNFKQDSSVSLALSMETIKMEKRDLRLTKVMKKEHLTKIHSAKKRVSSFKKNQNEITGKLQKFKFSTRKERSSEQNDRRALKKSAKKAIKKKKTAKQGRLMA
ncbi:hypothetical protein CAEBREN_16941 [Caenorhabditis brenneri]|uniref:RRM domain-containing protein n=1 Tax=Caenorhabditis brenneri TaxID=135651 RepID=G0PAF2_CAEBE|nr:hypothetical protein CAEBREN_16941 [Caenorhabditis brenneri]